MSDTQPFTFKLNLADDAWPLFGGSLDLGTLLGVREAYVADNDPVSGRIRLTFNAPFDHLVLMNLEEVSLAKALQLVQAVAHFKRLAGGVAAPEGKA